MSVTDHIVFIAGASDTDAYKEVAKLVINELNQHWGVIVPFRVISKTFSELSPGRAGYPQEVINRQLDGTVDTFTGLLFRKSGLATPDFRSGTSEEVHLALNSHESVGRPDPLIYRIVADGDCAEDPGVQELLGEISQRGVLYHPVSSEIEFERKYRVHLIASIQRRSGPDAEPTEEVDPGRGPGPSDKGSGQSAPLGSLTHVERLFYGIAVWSTNIMLKSLPHLKSVEESLKKFSKDLDDNTEPLRSAVINRDKRREKRLSNMLASRFLQASRSIETDGSLFHYHVGFGLMALDVASKGRFIELLDGSPRIADLIANFIQKLSDNLEEIEQVFGNSPSILRSMQVKRSSPLGKSARNLAASMEQFIKVNGLIVSYCRKANGADTNR